MKYKVGDRVKIKTWERMVEEFGFRKGNCIDTPYGFIEDMEEELDKLNCDRNLIIKNAIPNDSGNDGGHDCYKMEGIKWLWEDKMIECLVEDYMLPIPVKNRWEILDL